MKTKSWVLIGGGLVVLLAVFAWIFLSGESKTYTVEDHNIFLYVELLHGETIADVRITPTKEQLHLDIVYDSGRSRHAHIDTEGKGVLIGNFSLRPQAVHPDHLVDALGIRWNRWKDIRLLGEPAPNETLQGTLAFDPKEGMCFFIWGDHPRFARGAWQRNAQ